jgi:hypothetical protein
MARPRKDGTPSKQALSQRQQLFLAYLPHASSPAEAAAKAGYPANDLQEAVKGLFKSPHIQAALLTEMSAEGINGRVMSRYMRQGLDAKSYSMTKEGDVVELGPDWHARYKMLELVAKLSGAMPDPRMELTGAGGGAIVVRHTVALDGD